MKEHVLFWPFLKNPMHMEGLSGDEPFVRTLWLRRDLWEQQGKVKMQGSRRLMLEGRRGGKVGTGARGWIRAVDQGFILEALGGA